MNKRTLSLITATVSTITGIICILVMFNVIKNFSDVLGTILLFITWGGAIFSYIIGGGIKTALKWAWGAAKTGWFLIPVFPIDLITGIIGFFIGILGLAFLPLLPVMVGGSKGVEA